MAGYIQCCILAYYSGHTCFSETTNALLIRYLVSYVITVCNVVLNVYVHLFGLCQNFIHLPALPVNGKGKKYYLLLLL